MLLGGSHPCTGGTRVGSCPSTQDSPHAWGGFWTKCPSRVVVQENFSDVNAPEGRKDGGAFWAAAGQHYFTLKTKKCLTFSPTIPTLRVCPKDGACRQRRVPLVCNDQNPKQCRQPASLGRSKRGRVPVTLTERGRSAWAALGATPVEMMTVRNGFSWNNSEDTVRSHCTSLAPGCRSADCPVDLLLPPPPSTPASVPMPGRRCFNRGRPAVCSAARKSTPRVAPSPGCRGCPDPCGSVCIEELFLFLYEVSLGFDQSTRNLQMP